MRGEVRSEYCNFPIHPVGHQKFSLVDFFSIVGIAGLGGEVENVKQMTWFVGFFVLENLERNRDRIFPQLGYFQFFHVTKRLWDESNLIATEVKPCQLRQLPERLWDGGNMVIPSKSPFRGVQLTTSDGNFFRSSPDKFSFVKFLRLLGQFAVLVPLASYPLSLRSIYFHEVQKISSFYFTLYLLEAGHHLERTMH